ncbi:hypothetical protein BPTFM16_01158 [Altererythrobacter insulae]|nr:hypothetical protein BPTFM16_01158 [Altererythrobacter insulae]
MAQRLKFDPVAPTFMASTSRNRRLSASLDLEALPHQFRLLVVAKPILARCTRVKEPKMTIQLRAAFLAAAIIYAGVSLTVIATPTVGIELIELVISDNTSHL